MPPKAALIHIGTHKTGTTSFQALLSENWRYFRDQGLYYPVTGRRDPVNRTTSYAHHNLASELKGGDRYRPSAGSFEDLVGELKHEQPTSVLLSSEAFESLYRRPDALWRIRETFEGLGYDSSVIMTLRQPSQYAESLYAELKGKGAEFHDANRFVEGILAEGAVVAGGKDLCFDYLRLATSFAEVFGDGAVGVVRYEPGDSITPLVTACGAMLGIALEPVPGWQRLNTREGKEARSGGVAGRLRRVAPIRPAGRQTQSDGLTASQREAVDAAFAKAFDDAVLRFGK